MKIKIHCPYCQQRLLCDSENMVQVSRCPGCGNTLIPAKCQVVADPLSVQEPLSTVPAVRPEPEAEPIRPGVVNVDLHIEVPPDAAPPPYRAPGLSLTLELVAWIYGGLTVISLILAVVLDAPPAARFTVLGISIGLASIGAIFYQLAQLVNLFGKQCYNTERLLEVAKKNLIINTSRK